MTIEKWLHRYKLTAAAGVFVLFLFMVSGVAGAKNQTSGDRPAACAEIRSPLERLSCFDKYFKTPIYIPDNAPTQNTVPRRKPEILKIANRMENERRSETAGLLHESSIEYEESSQERVVLTAPALGSRPPRPILIISCMNNITRFQLGLSSPIDSTSVKVTLTLNDRSVGGDYHWRVIGSGQLIDAGHGIPSINILKDIVGHERLLINTSEPSLQGIIFDITAFKQYIRQFRTACHW